VAQFGEHVVDGVYRMVKNHAWSRVSHHGSYLLSHIATVAMYEALAATVFVITKGAFVQARVCISQQFSAFFAWCGCTVVVAAVYANHHGDHRLFVGNTAHSRPLK
jgi:hypothetical protein